MRHLLVILILISACTQGKRNEQFQQGLQFSDNFEDGVFHITQNGGWWNDLGWGATEVIPDPTGKSDYVWRSYLPVKKYPSNSEARATANFNSNAEQEMPMMQPWLSDIGISFKFYIPDNWQPGPVDGTVFQFHQKNTPEFNSQPPFSCGMIGNTLRVSVRTAPENDKNTRVDTYFPEAYTFTKNHWHYFVINAHWDYRTNGNGFFKVYVKRDSPPDESDIVANYSGGTGFNAENDNTAYFNAGVYMARLQYQSYVDQLNALGITEYEYYYDDIIYQDSYIDLSPIDPPPCETDTIYIPADTIYLQPKIYVVADSTLYEIETIQ